MGANTKDDLERYARRALFIFYESMMYFTLYPTYHNSIILYIRWSLMLHGSYIVLHMCIHVISIETYRSVVRLDWSYTLMLIPYCYILLYFQIHEYGFSL